MELAYTIGAIGVYDNYIAEDTEPRKAIGGAVWPTHKEAQAYLDSIRNVVVNGSGERVPADVYPVEVAWNNGEVDTGPNTSGCAGTLRVPARLHPRDKEWHLNHLIEAAKRAIDAIADAPNASVDERRLALNDVSSQLDICLKALDE